MTLRGVPNRIGGVVRGGRAVLALAALAVALWAGSASTAVAANVDPAIADGSAQRQLDAARARWRAAGIVDYHFTARRICFCAPKITESVTIVVRNGMPLNAPGHLADAATVSRLHQVIRKAIVDRVAQLTVRYDARGAPLEILIDPNAAVADEEIRYVVSDLVIDHPVARGDVWLLLRWAGPRGDATRTLVCDDGCLRSAWPDPGVCSRLIASLTLRQPITIETRDLRVTEDPRLFSAVGHIEGDRVDFTWAGSGSGTRFARLGAWEEALGPAAIAAVRRGVHRR